LFSGGDFLKDYFCVQKRIVEGGVRGKEARGGLGIPVHDFFLKKKYLLFKNILNFSYF
jgi:hypothetical protein